MPKPRRSSKVGLAVTAAVSAGETQDLNFKVDPDFHKRFKIEAVKRGLSMREMLEQMAKDWWREHPAT
jgi:hypothetical protein